MLGNVTSEHQKSFETWQPCREAQRLDNEGKDTECPRAVCSTSSPAFHPAPQPGRGAGSAPTPSTCLRQGQTLSGRYHKRHHPARSCLHLA